MHGFLGLSEQMGLLREAKCVFLYTGLFIDRWRRGVGRLSMFLSKTGLSPKGLTEATFDPPTPTHLPPHPSHLSPPPPPAPSSSSFPRLARCQGSILVSFGSLRGASPSNPPSHLSQFPHVHLPTQAPPPSRPFVAYPQHSLAPARPLTKCLPGRREFNQTAIARSPGGPSGRADRALGAVNRDPPPPLQVCHSPPPHLPPAPPRLTKAPRDGPSTLCAWRDSYRLRSASLNFR